MPTKPLLTTEKSQEQTSVQFKVRTNLRGGSMESCQKAITDWKTQYDKWYMDALNSGRLKPPAA
jgi:hypothetical protein